MHEHDPQGRRLPIKIDGASNGEHPPQQLTPEEREVNRLASELADVCSRRLGQGRRDFLKSACGAAATLLACNQVWKAAGGSGGFFDIPEAAAQEEETAKQALSGDEFIMDLQTHCVDPDGDWAKGRDGKRWMRNLNEFFGRSVECGEQETFQCYAAPALIKEVFMDSDTDVAVISALWGGKGHNPTPTDYAAKAREQIIQEVGTRRGLIHGGVLPNEEGQIDFMEVQAKKYGVAAWKLYPQWGPEGVGYYMDDERYGIPMLEKARELDVRVVCSHRGLPLPGFEYKYSLPADIARAASKFPDLTFLCYHAGYEPGVPEGPYDPDSPDNDSGVDRLIRAHQEQGFAPNEGNLYAELGSVWRYCMSKPDQAAHLMGKLLKYFGEERICWGTDSLWYGSPQDQIMALRSFRISEAFQEQYDYPSMTDRARRQIFGRNAARIHNMNIEELQAGFADDPMGRKRAAYRENPNPSFRTYGPTTRKGFFRLLAGTGGRPG